MIDAHNPDLAQRIRDLGERMDMTYTLANLDDLLTRLEPVARSLGCSDELARVADIPRLGASYQRQRRVAEEHDGDLHAVVDALVNELDV